jgi:effector-binding domain-containing protein
MIDTPHLATLAAGPAALVRLTVPRPEIGNVMGPGLAELTQTVAAQGIEATGPWFTHHLRMDPEVFDFEIGVPVAAPVAPQGRVVPGELPAVRVVRTEYRGAFEGLPEAWGRFDAWIAENGHTPGAEVWEVYLAGPESSPDPREWRTQLNRPLKSA